MATLNELKAKAQPDKGPTETKPQEDPAVTFEQFLASVPPGRRVRLSDGFTRKYQGGTMPGSAATPYLVASLPGLSLYCGDSACDRVQNFSVIETSAGSYGSTVTQFVAKGDVFVRYYCRNCARTWKTFALRIDSEKDDLNKIFGYKYGEVPQFGPPLPAKLLQLAGEHADLLKKGRQSENQSLGIGAFGYYRRVVEAQKARLIDELQKAIERLGGNEKALAALETARTETQFTKALELMADVTPKELFVAGQNPLKLLHGPLSIGLHGLTDEQCLQKAHSVRIVLAALLERIQMITEEKAELDAAIRDLLPSESGGR